MYKKREQASLISSVSIWKTRQWISIQKISSNLKLNKSIIFFFKIKKKLDIVKSLVCVYLACKIEEFNISISQFLQNINSSEDKSVLANVILNHELMLIEKLDFQLTVHNFYRPFEGFLLDVKVTRKNLKIKFWKII